MPTIEEKAKEVYPVAKGYNLRDVGREEYAALRQTGFISGAKWMEGQREEEVKRLRDALNTIRLVNRDIYIGEFIEKFLKEIQ